MTTKLHVAVDALGNPLRVILSAGQVADIERAVALIEDQPAQFVVGDKGYDADTFVESITAQGGAPVIQPRSNRLNPRIFDKHIYKSRYLVQCFFSRIKQFRRIATVRSVLITGPWPTPGRANAGFGDISRSDLPRLTPARGPLLWEAAQCGDDLLIQPLPEYEFDQRIAW